MNRTRLVSRSIAVLALAFSACGIDPSAPVAPALASLRTIEDAARAGEQGFGVPADLVLALAWTETRWQSPETDAHDHVDHLL